MIKDRVAILIVSYNGFTTFKNCINGLKWIKDEENIEVFVTDNASDTDNLGWLNENHSWIKSKQNSFNGGFSYGVNRTYKLAKGFLPEYVLLLNPDTELSKESLLHLLENFKDEKVGIVGPKMIDNEGNIEESALNEITLWWLGKNMFKDMIGLPRGANKLIKTKTVREVPSVSGGCMMIRSEVMNEVGPFDEDYFMYVEDNDFCYKARKTGWKVIYDPTTIVLHIKGDSADQKSKATQDWYKERVYISNLIFFKKHKSETQFNILKAAWNFGMKLRILINKDKEWATEMLSKIDNIKYKNNG